MTANDYGVSFGGIENGVELVVMVAQPCEYIKYHQILNFK